MARPKPFIDCTSRFLTLDTSFACELPYLHKGWHRCTIKGEESRIVFHGNGYNVDAETVVKWKPLHDDYRYFEREADWLAAMSESDPGGGGDDPV